MKRTLLSCSLLLTGMIGLTSCEDHRNSPNAPFPERINFVASRQYPEGITYSAQLGKFLVSSLTQGKVGTVDTDGRYADLLSSPEMISSFGMRVAGDRLFVCVGDRNISSKSSAATAFTTAELHVYNLTSRQLERRTVLGTLLPGARHLANDLALTPDGTVYVTDSFSPVIYRITPAGQATILVNDPRFSSTTFGLNGIVYHPDNYLIVAQTGAGKLYKVDLANGNAITEVGELPSLPGDGLAWLNNDLYVVTGSGSRVAQVRSANNWQTASIVKTDEVGYNQATTNVAVNNQIYSINARIGETGAGVGNPNVLQANDYSIQRFK
jgi:sugar lactone lactonase YvrE